jgi:hypothetical protein
MPDLHSDRAPIVFSPRTTSSDRRCALAFSSRALRASGRVADFIPASSGVKGVFAARRESLSKSTQKRARSTGYTEFAAASGRKKIFQSSGRAAWKKCFRFRVPKSSFALTLENAEEFAHIDFFSQDVAAKRR